MVARRRRGTQNSTPSRSPPTVDILQGNHKSVSRFLATRELLIDISTAAPTSLRHGGSLGIQGGLPTILSHRTYEWRFYIRCGSKPSTQNIVLPLMSPHMLCLHARKKRGQKNKRLRLMPSERRANGHHTGYSRGELMGGYLVRDSEKIGAVAIE